MDNNFLSGVGLGSIISAVIAGLVGWYAARKNFAASSRLADASMKNAQTAAATAENADARRQEELRRSGVAEVCKFDKENFEQLRSALGELASIAHGGDFGPIQLSDDQRLRGVLLSLQLKMMIFPNTPLNEVLHLDIANIREHLSVSGATTICNQSLWSRYFDNALVLLDNEENRIRQSLATGTYVPPKHLPPATSMKDSYEIHGHY